MQVPRRKADELRKRDDGPIYLTAEGLRRLKERLVQIKRDLPELISETSRAAAYGDRSDSAEYSAAKSALRRANFQVLSVEEQLKRVVVISEMPNTSGKVQLGSRVMLEINEQELPHLTSPQRGEGKTQISFQILGPRETNPGKGCISNQSPLGAALMGRTVGETVTILTKNGEQIYKILEIK